MCGPVGTDEENEYAGLMESRRQQGEAAGEGSDEVAVASCFLGSEFQVGSRADVAWGNATAEDGDNIGSMGNEWQQGGVVCMRSQ